MAKKTQRGRSTAARAKTKVKVKARARTGMKAKAVRLLARISAKVRTRKPAKVATKVRAKVVAKRKVLARKAVTTGHSLGAQLAHNKQLVLDFYHKLIGEKDFEAARPYMGSEYRQHAPYAADGHAGVAE